MKKILLVFGTRPEAIKMAPVVKEFQKHSDKFETAVCVTAQHREMLDQVLRIFDIVPDIDLNIMQAGQDLTDITIKVLAGMRDVFKKVKPDIVLVQGDTTTSSATALAAFYQQIPVGHIEAGLRTHDIYSPWPEEINRQITGRIASWHFTPTQMNRKNLLNEGISDNKIFLTGNTVIDSLYMVLGKFSSDPAIVKEAENELIKSGLPLATIRSWNGNHGERQMILITGHRRENFGEGFKNICEAIRDLSLEHPEMDFVYPVHLNPDVRKPVHKILGFQKNVNNLTEAALPGKNVFLIDPLEYLPFIYLMQKCLFALTDSGGIQEEAPALGKPVLVMRKSTERPEGIDAGTLRLIGTNKNKIINEVNLLLTDPEQYKRMATASNPYGDGKAAERIVEFFLRQM